MSKAERENKESEKGMSRAHSGGGGKSVKGDEYVGSSSKHGIRFKVPEHRDLSKVRTPEK
jgi:hypothetical protein